VFLLFNFSICVVDRFSLGNHLQLLREMSFLLMRDLGACLEFLVCAVVLSKLKFFKFIF